MSNQPPPRRGQRGRSQAPPPSSAGPSAAQKQATALAQRQDDMVKTLRAQNKQIAVALPTSITLTDADRFVRTVITEFRRTPGLAECEDDSILISVMYCAQLGLWPGILGHCAFVPLRDKNRGNRKQCNLWIMYKGQEYLAWRGSRILIDAETVRANDSFDYRKGTSPYLDFRKAKGTPQQRGEPVAVWATGTAPDGRVTFNVMDIEEVWARRAMSQSWQQQGESSPWGTHPDAMIRKTGVKGLSSLLPLTAEVQEAFTRDDLIDMGMTRRLQPPDIREETQALLPTDKLAGVLQAAAEGNDSGDRPRPVSQQPESAGWSAEQADQFEMELAAIPDKSKPGDAQVEAMRDSPFEGAMAALKAIAQRAGGVRRVNGEAQGELDV